MSTAQLPLPIPPLPNGVQRPPPLTGEQEEKRLKMLEHFGAPTYKIKDVEENAELREEEKFWVSNECILRYLRASKWVLATAIQRLEDTLKWRREYGIYDVMTPEYVEPEGVTGKEILFGYDSDRRPALYMIPSRQNTSESPRQLQYATFMLERAIDLMGPGVETLSLLINFADRAKNPSINTARGMLNILQNHYPERLGLALVANVPYLVNLFFKVILPFVDPITRAKIRFNPVVIEEKIFAPEQVMKEWGGSVTFEWSHEKYWPELIRLCQERKAAEMKKWRELGGTVGISEWDFKTLDVAHDQEKEKVASGEAAPTVAVQAVTA